MKDAMLNYGAAFQRFNTQRNEILDLVKRGEAGIEKYLSEKYLEGAVIGGLSGLAITGIVGAVGYAFQTKAAEMGYDTLSGKILFWAAICDYVIDAGLAFNFIRGSLADFGRYLKHKKMAEGKNGN